MDSTQSQSANSIVSIEPRWAAVVRSNVSFAEIRDTEIAAQAKLAQVVPQLGLGAAGQGLTIFSAPLDGRMDYLPGQLVSGSFTATGGVEAYELPAGRAAYYKLVGPFDGLPGAWGQLFAWLGEQGLRPAGLNWQIYGPTAADPAQQKTFLYALLAEE